MIAYLLPFIYLAVCALCGYFGRDTRMGYWGAFILSIFFTPVLIILVLVLFAPASNRNGRQG